MGDAFKITTSYPEVYVKLHIIQVREERVIQINQTQYMFSKLKKYGYENCIMVVIPTDLNNVYNLSLHMGDGSIKFNHLSVTKRLLGTCNLHNWA